MQILVAAATAFEIAPFIKDHSSADVLITGVGVQDTLYHLTKRISLIDYEVVVQAGISGAFNTEIKLGKVVLVEADTFADVGIKTNKGFSSVFDEGLADPDFPPYTNGWLFNPNPFLSSSAFEKVKGITVNTVTNDSEHNLIMAAKYNADIESMEGAALHYVCLRENVPFIQLRSVSNYIGERDKSKWEMRSAIKNLNVALHDMYEELLHGRKKF